MTDQTDSSPAALAVSEKPTPTAEDSSPLTVDPAQEGSSGVEAVGLEPQPTTVKLQAYHIARLEQLREILRLEIVAAMQAMPEGSEHVALMAAARGLGDVAGTFWPMESFTGIATELGSYMKASGEMPDDLKAQMAERLAEDTVKYLTRNGRAAGPAQEDDDKPRIVIPGQQQSGGQRMAASLALAAIRRGHGRRH